MKTGYLIIDIQNDYLPGGKMELHASPEAAENAARLLAFFRKHGAPVFHVQHISVRPGATFFLPDTSGAEIFAAVRPQEGEIVVRKHYPNAFRDTDLQAALQKEGIDTLVVAGMMTHMCVDTSVRAANDLGFSCLLAYDACATRNLSFAERSVAAEEVQTAYLAAIDGSFARVLSTDQILAELGRTE